tara:strand:+ start:1306 stop:1647 length:342 start_codon:yes stop_codon:yes gene_type:complete
VDIILTTESISMLFKTILVVGMLSTIVYLLTAFATKVVVSKKNGNSITLTKAMFIDTSDDATLTRLRYTSRFTSLLFILTIGIILPFLFYLMSLGIVRSDQCFLALSLKCNIS